MDYRKKRLSVCLSVRTIDSWAVDETDEPSGIRNFRRSEGALYFYQEDKPFSHGSRGRSPFDSNVIVNTKKKKPAVAENEGTM
jgi:hypothetical protein